MVGIFGGKQQSDPMQSDDLVSNVPVDEVPGYPVSMDGMLSGAPVPSTSNDPLSSTAPLVDDHSHDDVGDYIMTEPAAQSAAEPEEHPYGNSQVLDINSPELAKHAVADVPAEEPVEPEAQLQPSQTQVAGPSFEDLSTIKQQALKQLSPLVSHLDQSPEEKFQTTMMMLQATDDHSLVKTAYEAAQAITDEKSRAQALLEVVNEINYFTQHKN